MTRTVITATLAAALFAPIASAQITFERIAPENSIFIAGVHNATSSRARFERTELHTLWRSDEMRELRREFKQEFDQGLAEAMRELGMERDDFDWPTGAVGFALFPVIDAERGMPAPAYVLLADYGDRADNFQRVIDAMLDRGRQEGDIEVEVREILNRTVRTITLSNGEEDEANDWGMEDDDDDWGFDDEDWGMGGGPFGFGGDAMGEFRTIHLVREGGAFIVCSDLGSITEILDRLDHNRGSGIEDRADFRNALDLIGANDAYAVLLTRDMMQLVQAFDPTGMSMMFAPMLRSLFGDISALSTGVLLDAPDAMVRNNFAVAMPRGKRGLTALVDVSKPRGPLPAYVGEGTHTYSVYHFAFGRIADAARQFVQDNPMLAMMGAAEMLEGIDPILRPMTGALGDRIHMVGSVTRPITADSSHTLIAVEARDSQQFDLIFSGLAGQLGLLPEEVDGRRIYASPPLMMPGMGMPAMPEMAIGVGGDHVFVGNRPTVERALGNAAPANGLGDNPQFRAAVERIPDVPLVFWGYTDIVTTLEAAIKAGEDAARQMMRDFGDDLNGDDMPAMPRIDFDLLRRHLGPSVSWMRSTDAGFVGTNLFFAADHVRE